MIRDVHHVGIAVLSIERALSLYRDALALAVVKEGEVPARGVRAAMVSVGQSYLELIEPVEEDSPFAAYIREHGEGLHHVALWCEDVEAQVAKLRDLGVPLEDEQPRRGFTGRLSYLGRDAFDGALMEVVQPEAALSGRGGPAGHIRRIDHVVMRVPSVQAICDRMQAWFDVPTKRTFERGTSVFAFMRPGDVIIEIIGPQEHGAEGTGRVAGLCFEVRGIDELTESLKANAHPIGDPHPALQGGRIVSIHHTGACGVPLAFIDFTESPGPAGRGG